MRVLTASQMREADRRAIEELGIHSLVLMENAGRQVLAAIEATLGDLSERSVAVLCGRGSNGGDGFALARVLHQRSAPVSVFVLGRLADIRGDARTNLEILQRLGVTVAEVGDAQTWELHQSQVTSAQLIVDAILGTGLRSPVAGMLETVIADVNAAGVPVVSIDMPSGLSADTCDLIGPAIAATLTVTLAAPKLPLVLGPAEAKVGQLVTADIGIPESIIDGLDGPRIEILTRARLRDLVPARRPDSHKGEYGHVLIVAGSAGKTGAAHLAAIGALRSGAGLVTVATPRSCQPIVAAMAAEYMTEALPETPAGCVARGALDRILELEHNVIAVGPGLGSGAEQTTFVAGLIERATAPLVIDADGLNALAADPGRLHGRDGLDIVITPHPGEMARLAGISTEQVQADRIDVARSFATSRRLHVVLKGHRTLVATPDGSVFVNMTGNPGMATGGTGDVLTGIIAAWWGQLRDAETACKLAVYLHGAAGDLAASDESEPAMTASDLVARLGDAFLELTARREVEQEGS